MFINTKNEILSLMPTARWDRPDQLIGYLEEEERVALEPLLGQPLYLYLCREYERLRGKYGDITSTTVRPDRQAKDDPGMPHTDVTERIEMIHSGVLARCQVQLPDEYLDVPEGDMQAIGLIRICQQIEFYRMMAHKAGLLTVSFNEGGGMNVISADGYDGADEKAKDRVVRDAFMSAGRSTDSLLLFLEADAKGSRFFTALWQQADAYYLHKDLLFQTARVLNEYLDIKSDRMAYVGLVRDIRFCQRTYLMPRIGSKLLRAVVAFANEGLPADPEPEDKETPEATETPDAPDTPDPVVMGDLLDYLRQALAFYVEGRRREIGPKDEKLARRDSQTDAQQAMAMACQFIEDNLEALGDAAVGSPIYNARRAKEAEAARDAENACEARRRQCQKMAEQSRRKLFTGFPATHIRPDHK